MTTEHVAEAEELRTALKSCPSDTKRALSALLKLFSRLGANVTRLSDFARSMDERNAERNGRINALEARIQRLESAREGDGA